MITCIDMMPAIGAEVLVRCESLMITCTVKDVKNAWGKPRVLVVPTSGSGSMWVEMPRVSPPASRGALAQRA